jgi:mRNA interferase MazF
MTTPITPFDVVLVPFPFSDLSTTKQRPCLALASIRQKGRPDHVIVAMMTSQVDGLSFPHDLRVQDLAAAGLPKPSLIRLAKVITLETGMIKKKLGTLSAADRKSVQSQLKLLFSLS